MTLGRILVVEDDDSLRRATEMQLAKAGYDAMAAADVPEALEILKASQTWLLRT